MPSAGSPANNLQANASYAVRMASSIGFPLGAAAEDSAAVNPDAPVYTKEPRSFELNEHVSTDRGRVTVSWVDSEDKSPYYVSFQYIGSSDVIQPFYWAGIDKAGSTTNSKSFTIDALIPGKTYKIEVRDCSGTSISRISSIRCA